MAISTVPLRPLVPQKFRLNINGIDYTVRLRWNDFVSAWVMAIHDASDVPLINGIPLITGANLLEQFDYLEIGGGGVDMLVLTQAIGHSPDEVPSKTNLGSEGQLYLVT